MVISVVKKGLFLVISVVKKRQFSVLISVVKRGSFGWVLAFLKGAVLDGY